MTSYCPLALEFPELPPGFKALPPGFVGNESVKRSLKDQLPRIIAELQRVTDYDRLLDDFSHRVRSARTGAQPDFQSDVTAGEPPTARK